MERADEINVYDKWNSTKWYNYGTFSLIPVFIVKKKDKMNNTNYLFKWLFIQAWTVDSFILGLSLFLNSFKGVGVSLQLPYLYIECSFRNTNLLYKLLKHLNRGVLNKTFVNTYPKQIKFDEKYVERFKSTGDVGLDNLIKDLCKKPETNDNNRN